MAKLLKKIPMYIFVAINLIMILAMNFCAYTSFLPPHTYPNWSYFGLMFPAFLAINICFVPFWLIFKWRLTALPLCGMLLCVGSIRTYWPINVSRDIPENNIKVLTYNVHAFGVGTATGTWEDNPIFNYITACDADIVCLQEAMHTLTNKMLEVLHDQYPYNDCQFQPQNHMLIMSKFPIISVKQIEYPSTNNFSYAYELQAGNDTIVLINNHLESYRLEDEDKEAYKQLIKNPENEDAETKYESLVSKVAKANAIRAVQVDSVAAYIERQKGRPVIACGDFNDPSISYTHRRLTRSLNDAYTRSGNGPGISYHLSGMYFRIDNILCSSHFTPLKAVVDNFIKESDHYPMYAYFTLEKQ